MLHYPTNLHPMVTHSRRYGSLNPTHVVFDSIQVCNNAPLPTNLHPTVLILKDMVQNV